MNSATTMMMRPTTTFKHLFLRSYPARHASRLCVTVSRRVYPSFLHQKSSLCFSVLPGGGSTPPPSLTALRFLSTAAQKPVRILYASQGGTAHLFAQQLAEALEENSLEVVSLTACDDHEGALSESEVHIFIASTAGVGEPPDNGRKFYERLLNDTPTTNNLEFMIFGLGNSRAHPNHYNSFAKNLQKALEGENHKNRSVLPLALGDDSECIEDDFDQWQESVIRYLKTGSVNDHSGEAIPTGSENVLEQQQLVAPCPGAILCSRRISQKFPQLLLKPSETEVVRQHIQRPEMEICTVTHKQSYNHDPVSNGLMELRMANKQPYEAGDHVVIQPRNPDYVVEAVLNVIDDVDPYALVVGQKDEPNGKIYPHPTQLSVYETLSHCVDLSTPNLVLAKFLFPDIDYKRDVAEPRTTVMELLVKASKSVALEDLLYQLAPLRPRYYSIASSSLVHGNEIYIVYRPVRYLSKQGHLREGLCSSFLAHTCPGTEIQVAVRTSTFRLPKDPSTPIALIAGGCGVAPIRSFLEERVHLNVRGPAYLFLGFRNPLDMVYQDLIDRAVDEGALTQYYVTYNTGCAKDHCGLVSGELRRQGQIIYDLIQQGGYLYVCGGARAFGVAIENELHHLLQKYGGMTEEEATNKMRELTKSGRLNEDLAD